MTVQELITKLNAIEDKTQEVILEDSVLCLAVGLTHIHEESEWQAHSIDLCGAHIIGNDDDDDDE